MKKSLLSLVLINFILLYCNACKVYAENSEKIIYTDKAPTETSLGYRLIKPDEDFFKIMTFERMIYVIEAELDLKGKKLSIPKDSILQFNKNGCIKNGAIEFNKTYLNGSVKFSDCSFSGKLINNTSYLSWFGLTENTQKELSNHRKNCQIISEVLQCIGNNLIIDGFFPVSSQITINTSVTFKAADWNTEYITPSCNYSFTPKYGFYTTANNVSLFNLEKDSDINMLGLYLKGNPDDFLGNTINSQNFTFAFDSYYTRGSLHAVYNCLIEGFNYGVRSFGSYIEKIQNTTFNACQFGVYSVYTSDFDIYYCKFTNCMPNIKLDTNQNLTSDAMSFLRQAGSGIFCEGCGMLDYAGNSFENNFVNIIIDEGDVIINISDNIFYQPVFTDIYIYNDGVGQDSPFMSLGKGDLKKFSIDNLVISKNKFIKTKNDVPSYTLFIRDTNNLPYTSEKRDRGTKFVFSENIITDSRTSITKNDAIIGLSCQNAKSSRITCYGNNFLDSKSKYGIEVISGSSGFITFINSENQITAEMLSNFIKGDSTVIK